MQKCFSWLSVKAAALPILFVKLSEEHLRYEKKKIQTGPDSSGGLHTFHPNAESEHRGEL